MGERGVDRVRHVPVEAYSDLKSQRAQDISVKH